MTTNTPRGTRTARRVVLTAIGLVLLTAGTSLAASPDPVPRAPSNQPDHGAWLLVLIIAGFVLAGVATLALAQRNSKPRDE